MLFNESHFSYFDLEVALIILKRDDHLINLLTIVLETADITIAFAVDIRHELVIVFDEHCLIGRVETKG
jgi:hypothetical protein